MTNKLNSNWKPVFAGSSSSDEDDENKYCIICAEKLIYCAKSPCNHTTCHICTFRQRALYKKDLCLVCRTDNDDLIFTDELTSSYQELKSKVVKSDKKYKVSFTSLTVYKIVLSLLEFDCIICSKTFKNFNDLFDHLSKIHDKYLCLLCSENKKAFPFELKVYSQKQLQTHLIKGDENDENFKGHPICKFCKGKRFYSTDELNLHLRKNHEECHVCKQIDSLNPQYFKNYDSLEDHFRTDHYICTVQSCLDAKFVVFPDEIELKTHLINEHNLSNNNLIFNNSKKLHSKLSTFEEPNDSLKVKKLRLEERARHYCNYDTTKFKLFQELNASFNNGYITAQDLKATYAKLFNNNSQEEVNLLLFDLCETLNNKNSQTAELKNLVSIEKKMLDNKNDDLFPALSSSSSNLELNTWVTKKKPLKRPKQEDFPPLSVPKPTQKVKSWASVSHTVNPVSVKKATSVTAKIPNYLETKKVEVKKKVTLSDELFPALPTQQKKVIPRVNPIPKGNGSWDTGSPLDNLNSLQDELPIPIKKGKKKKQILFQSGRM